MSFHIIVALQGGRDAESGIARIETSLARTTDASGRARDALGRFAATGADAGAKVAKGAEDAARAHDRARDAAAGQGDALTKLLHLAEAYLAIHQAKEVVDGYVEISNKLRVVATDQGNLNGLLEATLGIAQDTRTQWETVTSTYQRLSNVTHGLGLSQKQVLDLTRELAIGAKISGASAQESAMAQAELTHAFATGALQGREFRVLMRDVPALLHELQLASGKTGAEFAEMGKHGQITAKLLIDWFGKAGPALDDKFGRTIPTIADGFTRIHNAAEAFFGDAAVASGTLGTLGAAMAFVADHFEAFAKAALGVAEALLGLLVIEKIVALVKALTVAIAANPLGAILTALTIGISLLRQFGDQIETHIPIWTNVKGVFVTVGDELDALWAQFQKLGAEILAFLGEAWRALTQSFHDGLDSTGMEFSLSTALRLVAGFVGAVRGLFQVMAQDSDKSFALMAYTMTELMVTAA
ncbi:MAG: tape measure protein, partial [Deltaproteobacteria bacterium]